MSAQFWERDSAGRMVAKPVDPKYLDAKGNIIPLAERTAASDRAQSAAAAAASMARREALEKMSPLQKRIALFEEQEAKARRAGDVAAERMYATARIDLQAEQATVERREKMDADPWVKTILEQRDLMARSGRTLYTGSDPLDLDTFVSLVDQRHDFPDARSFQAAVSEVQTKIVDDHLAYHKKAADDANLAALAAQSESASANFRLAESQLRAAQIQGAANGA